MMLMVGVVLFFWFVSLSLMCLYRDLINPKFWNPVFIVADLIAFFCWNYAAYQRGWLDDRFMTLDNISPMICTMIPLTCFMKDKVKECAYSAFSFLSLGMFFAMMISPEHAYLFSFNEEASFLYASEAVCHLICSLFGVYLVMSEQVKPDFEHWIKSMLFMYSIVGFGVFLNYVFHKNFFGMDPYGNYTIYMIDIFGTFEATLAAYILGILVVLTLGLHFQQLLDKTTKKLLRANGMKAMEAPAQLRKNEDENSLQIP